MLLFLLWYRLCNFCFESCWNISVGFHSSLFFGSYLCCCHVFSSRDNKVCNIKKSTLNLYINSYCGIWLLLQLPLSCPISWMNDAHSKTLFLASNLELELSKGSCNLFIFFLISWQMSPHLYFECHNWNKTNIRWRFLS